MEEDFTLTFWQAAFPGRASVPWDKLVSYMDSVEKADRALAATSLPSFLSSAQAAAPLELVLRYSVMGGVVTPGGGSTGEAPPQPPSSGHAAAAPPPSAAAPICQLSDFQNFVGRFGPVYPVSECLAKARASVLDPNNGKVHAWFHGHLSRQDAEHLLVGASPGSFLMRYGSVKTAFGLSYVDPFDSSVRHTLVHNLGVEGFSHTHPHSRSAAHSRSARSTGRQARGARLSSSGPHSTSSSSSSSSSSYSSAPSSPTYVSLQAFVEGNAGVLRWPVPPPSRLPSRLRDEGMTEQPGGKGGGARPHGGGPGRGAGGAGGVRRRTEGTSGHDRSDSFSSIGTTLQRVKEEEDKEGREGEKEDEKDGHEGGGDGGKGDAGGYTAVGDTPRAALLKQAKALLSRAQALHAVGGTAVVGRTVGDTAAGVAAGDTAAAAAAAGATADDTAAASAAGGVAASEEQQQQQREEEEEEEWLQRRRRWQEKNREEEEGEEPLQLLHRALTAIRAAVALENEKGSSSKDSSVSTSSIEGGSSSSSETSSRSRSSKASGSSSSSSSRSVPDTLSSSKVTDGTTEGLLPLKPSLATLLSPLKAAPIVTSRYEDKRDVVLLEAKAWRLRGDVLTRRCGALSKAAEEAFLLALRALEGAEGRGDGSGWGSGGEMGMGMAVDGDAYAHRCAVLKRHAHLQLVLCYTERAAASCDTCDGCEAANAAATEGERQERGQWRGGTPLCGPGGGGETEHLHPPPLMAAPAAPPAAPPPAAGGDTVVNPTVAVGDTAAVGDSAGGQAPLWDGKIRLHFSELMAATADGDDRAKLREHLLGFKAFASAVTPPSLTPLSVGASIDKANALFNLNTTDSIKEAASLFSSALCLARCGGWAALEVRALGNLGTVSKRLGKSQLAVEYYTACLALARRLRDSDTQIKMLNALGLTCLEVGRLLEARRWTDELLPLAGGGEDLKRCKARREKIATALRAAQQ